MSAGAIWARTSERGSSGALRVFAWIRSRFGRSLCLALLTPIAAYFVITDASTRRASLRYLRRLQAFAGARAPGSRQPGLMDGLRHVREFALQIFDRICAWTGGADGIEIRDTGSEHLFRLARQGRGALLLGAHLGSFDLMRLLSQRQDFKVNALMFTQHTARITAFFERLNPGQRLRVIELDPRSVRSIFQIKACIGRGEFVGILGDRVSPGERGRSVTLDFLGRPASFPLGPFLLAGMLGCPLLLTLCLRTGDRRYETLVQPLSAGERVPRARREQRARELLEIYVRALERTCQRAPEQWFNFYDFWDASAAGD